MKNLSVVLASLAIYAVVSCKDKQEEPSVIEKETVVIEKAATPTPAIPVQEDENGTSISVSKDGVGFSTKDGDKKTEIEVKNGSGSVDIKK